MLTRLRFWWHFRKNQFARVLAQNDPSNARPLTDLELWAFYRLGMYETIARVPVAELGWQGAFAKTVSLAACGEAEGAKEFLARFQRQPEARARGAVLAEALVPFMPEAALRLIEGQRNVPTALQVAAWLRCGRARDAQRLLDELPPAVFAAQPELHLLRTNASAGGAPAEQLGRLNAFLQAHGVPALRLRDVNRPPSPCNVMAGEPTPEVQGPLVSVVMTTYRTAVRAVAAVESVLAQSYRHLELIVVDDASGDDTIERLQALALRDARLRLVTLPRNVGTYAAKLIGLARARGEFLTCHDSDDWSHPEKIARQVAPLLKDQRLVCTVSNWVRMGDDGRFFARQVYPLTRLNPSSLLFRRERVLREAGAWDCVRTGADSEFLARLKLVFGDKAVRKVAQPLTLGSHRPDSLMNAPDTGYSPTGLSPQRLAYWEAWNRWHIDTLARGRKPFMPADVLTAVKQRPFDVPEELRVRPEDVQACLEGLSRGSVLK